MSDNKNDNGMIRNDLHEEYVELLMGNMNSIYQYIVTHVPHASDSEDILQETSKTIWAKFSNYDRGTSFKNWAITIARYKILSYYRNKKRSKVKFSSRTLEAIEDYLEERKENDGHEQEVLKKCLSKLPIKDRKLIQMKYSQKITTKSLAIQIGRSVSGLYSSLARIQKVLVDCTQKNMASEVE